MRSIRLIAFISRLEEIDDFVSRAPEVEFVFATFCDLADAAVRIDPSDDTPMFETFGAYHASRPFCGVVNRKEKYVAPAAALALKLGLPPILTAPQVARDKYQMRLRLNGDAIFPRTILVRDAADLAPVPSDMFPCVLKPRFGFNSRSVCLAKDSDELRSFYADQHARYHELNKQDGTNSDFVVEELIRGTEHTIESLVRDGEPLLHIVSDKHPMTPPYFIEVGDISPSCLGESDQQLCRQAADDAITRLGIRNGWTHTEVKLDSRGPVVIECAARMGGGYFEQLIEEVYGIDRLRVLIDLFLGRDLPCRAEPRCQVAARRFVVYGGPRRMELLNPEEVLSAAGIRLIWPKTPDLIGRTIAGPPDDFNNTLFEYFAYGETAAEARSRADDALRRARISQSPL
jgi:biotin carboxylase